MLFLEPKHVKSDETHPSFDLTFPILLLPVFHHDDVGVAIIISYIGDSIAGGGTYLPYPAPRAHHRRPAAGAKQRQRAAHNTNTTLIIIERLAILSTWNSWESSPNRP